MSKDEHRQFGQEVTDNIQREIAQYLTRIEPAIEVKVEYIDVTDRPGCQVIAIYLKRVPNLFVWSQK